MLNEYDKRMKIAKELGVMPIPENCARIGSYATDNLGVRLDLDTLEYFMHGADPDEDELRRPSKLTRLYCNLLRSSKKRNSKRYMPTVQLNQTNANTALHALN